MTMRVRHFIGIAAMLLIMGTSTPGALDATNGPYRQSFHQALIVVAMTFVAWHVLMIKRANRRAARRE